MRIIIILIKKQNIKCGESSKVSHRPDPLPSKGPEGPHGFWSHKVGEVTGRLLKEIGIIFL